ncbi:hypothetical protein [Salipaludibacillus aurantiacus]|uniref:Uncharacterized protein n=1 Tax=Salipaludibacillus aurantiacus TaxID=1601833 RepID=A0A1H9TXS8_9BACI|nr:hypothetical protein [Salipaludibacillus aurantiacus]SES01774.1 hypothetical protein SAMN05518684_106147 [Salipaludibacillus aurantiacus]
MEKNNIHEFLQSMKQAESEQLFLNEEDSHQENIENRDFLFTHMFF